MVKPLFGNDDNIKKTDTASNSIKPLSFDDRPSPVVKQQSAGISPKALSFDNIAPQKINNPIPTSSAGIFETNTSTNEIVAAGIVKFKQLNNELYTKNAVYCNSQMNMLVPLKIDVVLSWGGKTMDKMLVTNKETTRLIDTVAQTNCNAFVDDLTKKLIPSSNKLVHALKSKFIDTAASEATLKANVTLFNSLLPKCDNLKTDLEYHYNQVILKLMNLTALTDALGIIPDANLETSVYKRKMLLQQGATQAQILLRQLEDTKTLMITQMQLIDQLLTITIPAFNAIKR